MVIIFVGKRSQIIHLIFQGCSIATNPNNAALYPVPTPFSHRKKGKHAIHQAAKNTNRWWHWYQSFLHFSSNYLEYWCRYDVRYTIVRCCVDTTPRRVCVSLLNDANQLICRSALHLGEKWCKWQQMIWWWGLDLQQQQTILLFLIDHPNDWQNNHTLSPNGLPRSEPAEW